MGRLFFERIETLFLEPLEIKHGWSSSRGEGFLRQKLG
jgi:hypothetical protein